MTQADHPHHVATVVRRNVTACVIASVLLCYYGYVALAEPTGKDLYSQCNWFFFHTLRIGGPLMLALAVWSGTGAVLSLAVDGVVSITIGVMFALSGGGMLLDGGAGLNSILIVIFGMMFVGSGRRNWQVYRHLKAGGRVMVEEVLSPPLDSTVSAPPVKKNTTPAPESVAPPEPDSESIPEPEVETPPGGFLASMGKQPPPPNS